MRPDFSAPIQLLVSASSFFLSYHLNSIDKDGRRDQSRGCTNLFYASYLQSNHFPQGLGRLCLYLYYDIIVSTGGLDLLYLWYGPERVHK